MCPLFLLLAAFAAGPSIESVLQRMSKLAIPDTADYRTTASIEAGPVRSSMSAHTIQAGPSRRWMEFEVGGRKTRMVTSEGRTVTTDLASGKTMVLPGMELPEDPTSAMRRFLSSRWNEPRSLGGSRWELVQDVSGDSLVRFRSVEWDDASGRVERIVQVGAGGDTTALDMGWTSTGGHVVPSTIRIAQTTPGGALRTSISFSDWKFPRSVPANLFAIP
jgi:hypothetical protein